ncbi:MAG TPA: ABC transporter substrate-binding protein [Patescibacteria group bacterium]|nr:ABC transporter substrate-binding protein [Patescibacteria group bacterium]
MSRRDGGIAFALVAVLVVLTGMIAAPSFQPAATPAPTPTAAPILGHAQGVLGRPSSITPLTARTQVDRDLVALLFRGLVRLGPGTSVLPDLAERWTVSEDGARWTFHLRADARWHDGVPVTSRDVVYTVGVLHDPAYTGPLASTWVEVQATALDELTVQFDLGDPVGGFLHAAALPLLPAHILSEVPVEALADDPYAREPLGNGAFALVEMTADRAVMEPVLPQVSGATAPLGDLTAGEVGARIPRLPRLEIRFFDTAEDLIAAFTAGEVASAANLPPAAAVALAATPGARAIRYPTTTVTALAFNLRAIRGPFSDARTRRALVAALDRADLVADLLGGAGARAETVIPPSSWAYDAAAAPEIAYDRAAATAGLREAGWRRVDGAWIPPRASNPLAVTILAPEAAVNEIAHAGATRVAAAWTALGLAATVEALPPGELVERLQAADFTVAVIDVSMGLDPDPFPILASSQVRAGGANVSGLQDAALDKALVAARAPGSLANRIKAYGALQKLLATMQPMPVLFVRDAVLVADEDLSGPVARPIADPAGRFWDVVRWQTVGR